MPTRSAARWAPLVVTLAFVALILVRAGTDPLDLLRYAGYAVFAVLLPGTLVYRALRGRPHALVEDLAMGAAVGLSLELVGWAVFSALDLRALVWTWPGLVVVAFLAVPRLRRHWRTGDVTPAPLVWSWTVAGVVCFFTAYLAAVFLDRNPILPPTEATRQYLDLSYQLSLAGEAAHSFPPGVPQVAAEPLYYHWFAYVHMAMTGMVGQIDLPVVALRLAIPALCALAVLLTAVVGWRVSGQPAVGAVAAVLFFAVGEFNFTNPVTLPFGTQATFVIWHGMSMIYAWVLVIALILPLARVITDPRSGVGWWVLCGGLLLSSSGGKGSTLPVVALTLVITALVLLVTRRRIPWGVVGAGVLTGLAQLFAAAVLYRFQTYGVGVGPLESLSPFWAGESTVVAVGVWVAFGLNMLLRAAGAVPLLWLTRGRLDAAQWMLLSGGLAGVLSYLVLSQPGSGNQYFLRTGFAFVVIASAWGWWLLAERAGLSRRGWIALGCFAAAWSALIVALQLGYAPPAEYGTAFAPLRPMMTFAGWLALAGVVAAVAWVIAGRRWPSLRGRGALVLLSAALLAGAGGLVMDGVKSVAVPNGGPYPSIGLPRSRVDAARWVRDHSHPDDIVATNSHCIAGTVPDSCDSRSFWLSAYAERSVLVEGWGFAPRQAAVGLTPFWDPDLMALNESAFTAPTLDGLRELRDRHGVRWLVHDRDVGPIPSALYDLAGLTEPVYDNGRVVVFRLR